MLSKHIATETWLALASAVSALAATPLAQVVSQTIPDVPDWVSSVPATAILGWYAWHTTTRTIPQLVSDFRDDMKASRAEMRDELQAERNYHQANLKMLEELIAGLDASKANKVN
jgi:hypothetical protein